MKYLSICIFISLSFACSHDRNENTKMIDFKPHDLISKFKSADLMLSNCTTFDFKSIYQHESSLYAIEIIQDEEVYSQQYYFIAINSNSIDSFVRIIGKTSKVFKFNGDEGLIKPVLLNPICKYEYHNFLNLRSVKLPFQPKLVVRVFRRNLGEISKSVYVLDSNEAKILKNWLGGAK